MAKGRPWWFWLLAALLALALVPCIACFGLGVWWSRPSEVHLAQVPERPPSVTWEGEISQEEGLAWLRALVARDAPAEVWLGRLPPEISVALPEQARVVGGVKQMYPRFTNVRAWFRLPADQDALDSLMRALRRSGWREPVVARLIYRFALGPGMGKPPGGFVSGEGHLPSDLFRLYCGPEPGHFLELRLHRDAATGTLWGTLSLQDLTEGAPPDMPPPPCTWMDTLRFLAWAVRFPLAGILGLGPDEALPGVVRLPRLTPPPNVRTEVAPILPWNPGRYVGHTWLWVPEGSYLEARRVMEHYAAQMKEQGWKEVDRQEDEAGFHTRWEKSSLLGRRWAVHLSVLRHGPTRVSAWLYMHRADQPLEPERILGREPAPQAPRITVHGQATSEALRAWLEHWWSGGPGAMQQVQAMPGSAAPEPPIPVPQAWHLLGAVRTQWRASPWAPPPIALGSETLWVYQAQGRPEEERARMATLLEKAGWQVTPWSHDAGMARGFVLRQETPDPSWDWGEWCRPAAAGRPNQRVHLMVRPASEGTLWIYVTAFREGGTTPCPPSNAEIPEPELPPPEGWLPTLFLPREVRATYGPPLVPMSGSSVWLDAHALERVWTDLARQMEEQGWHMVREARSGPFRWSLWTRQREGRTLRLYLFAWLPEEGLAALFLRWDPAVFSAPGGD